jgi:hypothetical protein
MRIPVIGAKKDNLVKPMFARLTKIHPVCLFLACFFQSSQMWGQPGGWMPPIRINTDTFNTVAYPSMAMTHDGKIFVVWQHFSTRPYDIKARLFFSSFDGQSWSPEVAITDTNGTAWTPEIAVDTLGLPHVVWGEYSSGEIYHQWFDGLKWSNQENVSADSGASFYPCIAIDSKNNIHLVWHDNTGGDYSVYYRRFDGSIWSPTINLSDSLINSGDPRIAVDSKDNIHVAFDSYVSSPGNNYDIFSRSSKAGVWSSLARLTSDPLESNYPDVAVNTNNLPIVVWEQVVDNTVDPITIRVYGSTFEGSSWTAPASIADTSQSHKPRLSVDKNGGVHVVWQVYNQLLRSSQIMYSSSKAGTWTVPSNISGSTLNPSQPRIKADSSGICHVIYVGLDNGIYYTCQTGVDAVVASKWPNPKVLVLDQNYPNPFNSRTVIKYVLPQTAEVVFKVFDVLGREVKRLILSVQSPGEHSLVFEVPELSSGVYFYQIQADHHVLTREMMLLR